MPPVGADASQRRVFVPIVSNKMVARAVTQAAGGKPLVWTTDGTHKV
jgi:hypothetical protein